MALVGRVSLGILLADPLLVGDSSGYDLIALNLLDGNGISLDGSPSARRAPLYPLFLAGVYALAGQSVLAVTTAQGLLEVGTLIFVYLIARRLFSTGVALVASVIVAIHPALARMSTLILTETLFTFLLAAAMYLVVRIHDRPRLLSAAAAGVLFGLSALCRPTGMIVPVALFGTLFFVERRAELAKHLAVVCVFMVLTIAPWTARNFVQFQEVVPVSTGLGGNLFAGTYEPWDLVWLGWNHPDMRRVYGSLDPDRQPIEVDRVLVRESLQNIRDDPLTYLKLCWYKVWRLLRPTPGESSQALGSDSLMFLLRSFHVVLLSLSVAGLALRRAKHGGDVYLVGLLTVWVIFHALTFAIPRYFVPMMPFVAIFAARGLVDGPAQIRKWSLGRGGSVLGSFGRSRECASS